MDFKFYHNSLLYNHNKYDDKNYLLLFFLGNCMARLYNVDPKTNTNLEKQFFM